MVRNHHITSKISVFVVLMSGDVQCTYDYLLPFMIACVTMVLVYSSVDIHISFYKLLSLPSNASFWFLAK